MFVNSGNSVNVASGGGFGNMNQGYGNSNQVPQPRNKDFGTNNQNLIQDGSSSAANVTVSFGQLGSFGFNQPMMLPAPQEELSPTTKSTPSKETAHVYKLSKDECKEALLKEIDSQCCKSKKPIEEGHLTEASSYNALEYILETFNEKRSLVAVFSTCRPGENLSGLGTGQTPDPWTVACQPSSNYVNEVKKVTLPFTDVLQPCHGCNSYGQLKCASCDGCGLVRCSGCQGSKRRSVRDANGNISQTSCTVCNPNGMTRCTKCSGDGRTTCGTCQGVQVLKWYLQVHIQYINHVDKYTKEKTDLPDELIATVKGETLAESEGKQVAPISDSDSKEIADNSLRLIQKANQSYAQERRVVQRHRLICVTCAECAIENGGQSFKFWVYGEERKVYCPEYPGGCCCTII